jgi:very-short-patch-repair endonuclease
MHWEAQYRFNTGVHTNKLPRQFQLDFAHPVMRRYVEIDGSVHRLRTDRDARRDRMMTERGWNGLRIDAAVVRQDVDGVKQRILDWLRDVT